MMPSCPTSRVKETREIPGPFDVLLGRGKSYKNHSGNKRFQALVHANRSFYFKAVTKSEKRTITTKLTEEILKKGRFLKAEGKQWHVVPFESARQKIAHAIQYRQRCVGVRKQELPVEVTDCSATMGGPDERSEKCVENQASLERGSALLFLECDGTDDKMLGSASPIEGSSSTEYSISHFDSSDFQAASWSRTITMLQENTNIQFLDAEIPSPLQSLLRSTSDFSFGDCSLFGQSVLVTGNEKDYDIF